MKLNRPNTSLFLLIALLLVMASSVASAATIQIRRNCRPKGNIVLLGEVADVVGAGPLEVQALVDLELFIAPVTESQRVPVAKIQQAMTRRGIDISRHSFAGEKAVDVVVERPEVVASSSAYTAELAPRVCEAVSDYLCRRGEERRWHVSVLSSLEALSSWGRGPLRVVGDDYARTTGRHTFLVTSEAPLGTHTLVAHVECHVSLGRTDRQLDVAIEGDGFFQVCDPSTHQILYTRMGNLEKNADGNLFVTSAGVGRLIDPPISIPQDVTDIEISPDGIVGVLQPGNPHCQQVGVIQLARFENPHGLVKVAENLYEETPSSGQAIISNPGQQGLGSLRQGVLNQSDQMPQPDTNSRRF